MPNLLQMVELLEIWLRVTISTWCVFKCFARDLQREIFSDIRRNSLKVSCLELYLSRNLPLLKMWFPQENTTWDLLKYIQNIRTNMITYTKFFFLNNCFSCKGCSRQLRVVKNVRYLVFSRNTAFKVTVIVIVLTTSVN